METNAQKISKMVTLSSQKLQVICWLKLLVILAYVLISLLTYDFLGNTKRYYDMYENLIELIR